MPAFRRENPLGSTNRVVAVDPSGRYAGIVWLADAHAVELEVDTVADILHHTGVVLLPQMTVKEAVAAFEPRKPTRWPWSTRSIRCR